MKKRKKKIDCSDYYPSSGSDDPLEEKLVTWVQHRKTAKQGKGNGKFYQSDQKIAAEYGFSDLFETRN